jgi:hypothetical protein
MVVIEGVPAGCAALEQVESEGGDPEAVIAAIRNQLSTPSQRAKALREAGVIDTIAYVQIAEAALGCPHCGPRGEGCAAGAPMVELSGIE